jgi:hypothetical protein
VAEFAGDDVLRVGDSNVLIAPTIRQRETAQSRDNARHAQHSSRSFTR